MQSLLFWVAILLFLATGNIPVPIIMLVIALLLPAKPKRIKNSVVHEGKTNIKTESRSTWNMVSTSKAKVATHQSLIWEVSNSKRFAQILNSNLHFLAPLNEQDAKTVVQEAAKMTIAENWSGSLANLISVLLPKATESDIDCISETAIRKVQAAIAQTKAERLEYTWYIWRTCLDERVRSSHFQMEGVVCSFLNPPSPESLIGEPDIGKYNPGEARECRCYAEPIVDPDSEAWPKNAVLDGQFVSIDLRKFKALGRAMVH